MENGFTGIQVGRKCLKESFHLANQRALTNIGMQMEQSRFQENMKAEQNMGNGGISYKTVK